MSSLPALLRDLILLRRGPQDLPYSPRLLITLCVGCLLLQAIAGTISTPAGFGDAFLSGLIELALIFAALRIGLYARGLGNRLVQAMSAIVGCNLVFAALSLPLLLMLGELPIESGRIDVEKITSNQFLIALALTALSVWQLAVNARTLRQSFNTTTFASIAAIFGWIVLLGMLLSLASAPAP